MLSIEQQLWLLTYIPGTLFSLMIGIGLGSYATMAVWRLPRNEPWIGLPPRCLHCNTRLKLKDFFPLISWLRHKGKCAYCHTPIDYKALYLMVEISCIITSIACFLIFGFGEAYILAMALSYTLIITMAMDYDKRSIPNVTLWILLALSLSYRIWQDHEIFNAIFAGSTALLIAMLIRTGWYNLTKQRTIACDYLEFGTHDRFAGPGFSYVKLFTLCGIWCGIDTLPEATAIIAIAILMLLPLKKQQTLLPISLAIGSTWLYLLFTQSI